MCASTVLISNQNIPLTSEYKSDIIVLYQMQGVNGQTNDKRGEVRTMDGEEKLDWREYGILYALNYNHPWSDEKRIRLLLVSTSISVLASAISAIAIALSLKLL